MKRQICKKNTVDEKKEKCGQDLIKNSLHPRWLCDHDPLYSQTLPLSRKWGQFSQSTGLMIKIQSCFTVIF